MKAIIIISALVVSCIQFSAAAENDVSEIREPLIHVIISDEIRNIMLQINHLVNERELTQLQVLEERVKHLNNLIRATDKLMVAATTIRDAIPGVSMSPESRKTFEALARQLSIDAENLRHMAEATNYTGMEPAYQRMSDTCEACHRLFRF